MGPSCCWSPPTGPRHPEDPGEHRQCLGRSHDGFTTKIHLAAEGRCRPLAFVLTPGHYGDGPRLERVLKKVSVPRTGVGRPRTRPDRVLADKAYTSRRNRRCLRRHGIPHTIPERPDQPTDRFTCRTRLGRARGRTPPPGTIRRSRRQG
ncbi:transposase [Streptomyces sp. NPDC057543]|uniref:transposase n=1 Tax=Streptomyces sp. NPDC057543 TaxID=3346163 RepID=UPI003693F98C